MLKESDLISKMGIIIQARLGSTRLPNKVVLPFYRNQCILEILINRIKKVISGDSIIVATTNRNSDKIIDIAKSCSVNYFQGDEEDVLKRFIDAAESFKIKKIIRICSDNPFLDKESLSLLIEGFAKNDSDYMSFSVKGVPSIKTHYGFWAEAVKTEALMKVSHLTSEKLYHEHVTNYIYAYPESFSIKWIDITDSIAKESNIRLTIDSEEDFNIQKEIYKDIVRINPDFSIVDVISYLKSHNNLLNLMEEQIKKNTK